LTGRDAPGRFRRVSDLLEEQRGDARWLTLHRPAQRNALTPGLIAALREALARAEVDPAARVLCLTGTGRAALDLVLTGRRIDAHEALRVGLLNAAVPRGQLAARTEEICRTLAAKSPAALRLGRRAFYATQDLPYEQQLEALATQLSVHAQLEDAVEGVSAFLARRAPDWKGR